MTERNHILLEHDLRPYSVAQLADRWGCSGSVVRKLINQGELRCFRIGILIRIPAEEVQRYETIAESAEAAIATEPSKDPSPAKPTRRVIPRAPRRRKPIVIDRSKAGRSPSKGSR